MKTLVCLPTKNEKDSIEEMIARVRRLGLDMIIVDENSIDGTLDKAARNNVPVYQRDGRGKGWGVRKGLEVAAVKGYEVMVFIDCDCSYPTESIPRLLELLPEFDMTVGARDMRDVQFFHRLVNIFHTLTVNALFAVLLTDINSGLRALKVDKFRGLLDAEGFDIEAQITAVALRNGFKIRELAVPYRKRVGRSKIRYYDTLRIFNRIVRERFRHNKP